MVKIRLRRTGAKKRPTYRLVVTDAQAPRDGAFVETIGHYSPLDNPATVVIDEQKALHWLKQGAQPSQSVAKLLTKQGIMDKLKGASA